MPEYSDTVGKKSGRYRLTCASLESLTSPEKIDLFTFFGLQNGVFFDMKISRFRAGFHCSSPVDRFPSIQRHQTYGNDKMDNTELETTKDVLP